jgi:AcrR family transcriptional regulator
MPTTDNHGSPKPVRRGGRPSRAAAGEIEGQIVDVARDLFFAHGYGATSVETIAKHARISKRTFYHRFPNKAAIFAAVVNRLIQRVSPPDVSGLFEGKNCEELLLGLATIILQASLAPHTLALQRLILAEATRFPELALVMNEQGARRYAIQRIGEILERETREGRLSVENPALAAEMFMNMVIGIPQRRALGLGSAMTPGELKDWARLAVNLFLNGCQRH